MAKKKCEDGYKFDKKNKKCVREDGGIVHTVSSSRNYNVGSTGGVGFAGLLTILFIGLKLGKVIDWSWWWVLSPLWITAGIGVIIFLIMLIFFGVWLKNE